MKKRVKTVKEYDEICSEKAEGYVFLPEKDMDCLVEYVQTLGKTLKKDGTEKRTSASDSAKDLFWRQ